MPSESAVQPKKIKNKDSRDFYCQGHAGGKELQDHSGKAMKELRDGRLEKTGKRPEQELVSKEKTRFTWISNPRKIAGRDRTRNESRATKRMEGGKKGFSRGSIHKRGAESKIPSGVT